MKEALKLALEALEMFCEHGAILRPIETRDAIKEALAQPEQEPVAYGMWDTMLGYGGRMMMVRLDKGQDGCTVPLYATPPQRKPLSDEEIYSLADSLEIWNEDDEEWILDPNTFARAIEAKLKEQK